MSAGSTRAVASHAGRRRPHSPEGDWNLGPVRSRNVDTNLKHEPSRNILVLGQ